MVPNPNTNDNSLFAQLNNFNFIRDPTDRDELPQPEDETEITLSERLKPFGILPYSLIMKVSASEPRDVLQLERTFLSFIRFATSLFFTALGIVIRFKLDSSGNDEKEGKQPFDPTEYSTAVSYILFFFSLSVLIVSGINYFVTIKRYAKHKIETYNFNNMATVICMTCIILILMAISISLIIEGYLASF